MISCRTLGPVDVSVDGNPAPAELLWRKHLALLVYLARSPRGTRSREHLVTLLWGDKPEQAARHSLNEALRVLRRCFTEETLDTEGDTVRLDASAVAVDVDDLEQHIGNEDWGEAAALIDGEFLEGFTIPNCSPFEEWLSSERMVWRSHSVEVLAREAERLAASGEVPEATRLGMTALDLDPLSDRAMRAVMHCLALAGDRPAALARYGDFCERLKNELDITPEVETESLATRVRAERFGIEERAEVPAGELHHSRRAPLVGRTEHLKTLLASWDTARADAHSALFIIEGDGGTGKTRLLSEVVARARLGGAAVIGVRAVEGDRAIPGSGLIAVTRSGLLDVPGVTGASPLALAALAEHVPESAHRAPNEVPPLPLPVAVGEAFRAIVDEQPLLVVVDDVHWLDQDSLIALLANLRDLENVPFGLALTTSSNLSPDELERARAGIGRDIPGAVTTLAPWNTDALSELAQWYLPAYSALEIDRVVRRLATDSAGLPLLAVELLHAVTLGLDLRDHSSAWPEPFRTMEETLPGDVPDAVRAAIRIGFRSLDENAQQVLATVSVVGERVTPEQVTEATGLSRDVVLQSLDLLEWRRWLMAEARGYSFLARLPRDIVAADMLTRGQRNRLRAAMGLPETSA